MTDQDQLRLSGYLKAVHSTEVVGLREDADLLDFKYFRDLLAGFVAEHCGAFVEACLYREQANEYVQIVSEILPDTLQEDETVSLEFEQGTILIGAHSGWRQFGVSNCEVDTSLEFGSWMVSWDRPVRDESLTDAVAEKQLELLWNSLLSAGPVAAAAGEELYVDWDLVLEKKISISDKGFWYLAIATDGGVVEDHRAVVGGTLLRRGFFFRDVLGRGDD